MRKHNLFTWRLFYALWRTYYTYLSYSNVKELNKTISLWRIDLWRLYYSNELIVNVTLNELVTLLQNNNVSYRILYLNETITDNKNSLQKTVDKVLIIGYDIDNASNIVVLGNLLIVFNTTSEDHGGEAKIVKTIPVIRVYKNNTVLEDIIFYGDATNDTLIVQMLYKKLGRGLPRGRASIGCIIYGVLQAT